MARLSDTWSLRCQFLVDHLDLEQATGVEGAKWERFQLTHLNDDSTFRIETKSRQIAWSWLSAAEALAEAILDQRSSIFVSINQDEATEKLRYARAIAEALTPGICPGFVRDNSEEIELANGARLLSLPARPPRGKARMNVYLDEFAHIRDDRPIYTAALPVISKGGRLRVGSSPLGASGMFWEIAEQKLRPYPGYTRASTPWWEIAAFTTDIKSARREAPALPTAERVARFGNTRIRAIFDNMPVEDFQQEYECTTVDEATAWIPWEEIRASQDSSLLWLAATCRGADVERALELINTLAELVRAGKVESSFTGGVDIGRTRNATEIYLTGLSTLGSYPLRLSITLEACPYDSQMAVIERLVQVLPITKLLIDQNGIGNQLAETLTAKYPVKVQGVVFTNQSKVLWATHTKMLVQQHKAPIPQDRDLAYQIHSIKRLITPSKNMVFDTDRNEKHHADKFWAWALALNAAHIQVATERDWN